MPNNKDIGKYGELIAFKYLDRNGYRIIEKNYRTKLGEIDIIAKDGKYIVFVEVKTRRSCKYGYPREAVDIYKQTRIKNIANLYLLSKKVTDHPVRFDVVEIILNGNEEINSTTLIKNAFQ